MSLFKIILSSIEAKLNLLKDKEHIVKIELMGNLIINTLKNGGKVLIAGNGGSAADAQHFALASLCNCL